MKPLYVPLNTLKKFRNRYAGRRAFIMGNGPSIKKHELKLLRNEYVFAVNLITLHSEFKNFRKCFYCLGDPRFYQNERLLPEISKNLSINAEATSFFEIRARDAVIREQSLNDCRYYFVEIDPAKKCWEGSFHSDLEDKLCWGYSVVIDQCLPIAIYMGFNPIYLIGCDCDYGLDAELPDFKKAYFYDPETVSPEYLNSLNSSRQLPDQFNQSGKIFLSYQTVQRYCEATGIKVYNAGFGGKLDIFERVPYQSLFR